MSRLEWVHDLSSMMSQDVKQVAKKYEEMLKELQDAQKDVKVKEEGLFEICHTAP